MLGTRLILRDDDTVICLDCLYAIGCVRAAASEHNGNHPPFERFRRGLEQGVCR